jgi:hypothetical protein
MRLGRFQIENPFTAFTQISPDWHTYCGKRFPAHPRGIRHLVARQFSTTTTSSETCSEQERGVLSHAMDSGGLFGYSRRAWSERARYDAKRGLTGQRFPDTMCLAIRLSNGRHTNNVCLSHRDGIAQCEPNRL